MAVPPGQTYVYSPLPSDTSIRLLQILSGPEEPIRCSLEVVDLKDSPLYDCLSYTWGDPLYHELSAPQNIRRISNERNIPITCDGLILHATENLREALLQLSRNGSSPLASQRQRLIWIDAVCIDQGNMSEKGFQIDMMNKIYKAAQTVIVWLGIEDEHTSAAVDVMDRLASIPPDKFTVEIPPNLDDPEVYRALGIPYIEPQQWLDYAAFLQRSWFSRVWVIQESFEARNIVVLCGTNILRWSNISAGSQVLKETPLGELLTSVVVNAVSPSWASSTYAGNTLTNPYIFENMRQKATSLNLEKLLVQSRYFNATDDRDHVFALLGMRDQALAHKVPYEIQSEQTLDVQQVYAKASLAMIYEMEDLNILSLVEDTSFRRLKNLPSWVPDYSVAPQTYPLAGSPRAAAGTERWNASNGLKWEVPVQTDLRLLPVKGIQFDTIVEFAATKTEITDQYQIVALLDLLANYPQPQYPTGDPPTEAFWKTLIKDTYTGHPADESARRAFRLLIALNIWELKEAVKDLRGIISSTPDLGPNDPIRTEHTNLTALYARTKSTLSTLSTKNPQNSPIPSWPAIKTLIAAPPSRNLDRDSDHIADSFRVAYNGRRLFRTERGYLGIAAQSLRVGDGVWVLAGARVPVVLRRLGSGHWGLVGEAYVHGVMAGEGVGGGKVQGIFLE
jgi:Heterokaryon incompatibility protein (HET)